MPSLIGPFLLANSGQIMTINKENLFVFEVRPSVKFLILLHLFQLGLSMTNEGENVYN